jgi:hypothetical protein
MATIDELLDESSEGTADFRRVRLTPFGLVVQIVVIAASLAGVVWGLVRAVDYFMPYPLIFLVFLAVLAGWRVVWFLRAPAGAAVTRMTAGEPEPGLVNRPFAEARRWVDRLAGVRGDVEEFRWTVLPAVKALADERLRLRYGITRYSHPNRAAELLGPGLSTFLDSRKLRRVPTPAELAALVKELEEL